MIATIQNIIKIRCLTKCSSALNAENYNILLKTENKKWHDVYFAQGLKFYSQFLKILVSPVLFVGRCLFIKPKQKHKFLDHTFKSQIKL